MEAKQQKFSIGDFIAMLLALFLIQSVFFAFETSNQALFLNVASVAQREYSEETAHWIDAEIEQLLRAAHGRVHTTLGAPGSNRARGMWYRRRTA